MGNGPRVEASDVVLLSVEVENIPSVPGPSRATRRTLVTNLVIAFGAIVIMIGTILTAGIPLPVAVIGHEGSTVLVSLIGPRLLGYSG